MPVDDAEVPTTCTEAGETAGTHCSVCGMVLTAQEEIPALGHEFNEWNTRGIVLAWDIKQFFIRIIKLL